MPEDRGVFDLKFFKDEGFSRLKCVKCQKYFWSHDQGRNTCGDPPCDTYTFIGNPSGTKPMDINAVRESFIEFFRGTHAVIEPYPIVPRWREDVLLVNASIYDFQPHVTSGLVKPPGNPIVMSQPCIRMNDVDSVGFTGRHLTTFEMLCHDSFNYPEKMVYWKEETISYCYNFFTKSIGINGKLITFKENPWIGGGNAGNALEVFVKGLELATLVFMDLKEDPQGTYEIDGIRYSSMPLEVVDTGYGLERITWITTGTETVYDTVFPAILDFIKKNSSVDFANSAQMAEVTINGINETYLSQSSDSDDSIRFLRNAYIIGDHTRSLVHMLRDYVIPGNVKVGYLERMLLRRIFRASEIIHFTGDIMDLLRMHIESLKGIIIDFPYDFAEQIIKEEKEKYRRNIENGTSEVSRIMKKKNRIDLEDLQLLYDSAGIPPDLVREIAGKEKINVQIPDDFHSLIAQRHNPVQKEQRDPFEMFPHLKTRPLYYDDTSISEFNALVIFSSSNKIITNQTAFYPTGGGQPNDTGYFIYRGKQVQVLDVSKRGDSIIHSLESSIEEGSRIMGFVDKERRRRLMVHHSSTHLILGIMRAYLGEQVWQAGAQKGVESSRIDVTFNRKLTEEDINEIERRCLKAILENRKIHATFMDWNKATEKYGFRLFEGGVPLSSKLRVVEIEGIDVEGCGGTHLKNTGEIGFLKIISAESIQEGIQRITFCAGSSALDYIQENYRELVQVRKITRVTSGNISESVLKIVEENLELRKKIESAIKTQSESLISGSTEKRIEGFVWKIIRGDIDRETIQFLSKLIMSRNENFIIMNSLDHSLVTISPEPSRSREILNILIDKIDLKIGKYIRVQLDHDNFEEIGTRIEGL
ncbi:MAG: alanine--tRNA ligase [Thermoplasmataceae archaeon]